MLFSNYPSYIVLYTIFLIIIASAYIIYLYKMYTLSTKKYNKKVKIITDDIPTYKLITLSKPTDKLVIDLKTDLKEKENDKPSTPDIQTVSEKSPVKIQSTEQDIPEKKQLPVVEPSQNDFPLPVVEPSQNDFPLPIISTNNFDF